MEDDVFAAKLLVSVGRFALSVGAAALASWAGAPDWVTAAAAASGLLVVGGDRNPR